MPLSKFNRKLALITFCIVALFVYVSLHLNLLHLRRWDNSVQVEVQVLQGAGAGAGTGREGAVQRGRGSGRDSWQHEHAHFGHGHEHDSREQAHQGEGEEPATNPAPAPEPEPEVDPQTEPEFELYLSVRRLVILATHRINELVRKHEHKLQAPIPCSPWWANPLDIQQYKVADQTAEYVDHQLEFVAVSAYETRSFSTVARVFTKPPHDVKFMNDNFTRVRGPFQKFLDKPLKNLRSCLTPKNSGGTLLDIRARKQLEEICSCNLTAVLAENPDTGLDVLTSWPPNSSFLVGDYMNFDNYPSMFNILPVNRSQHCGDTIRMLVMVSSAPPHVEHRRAIRETYGSRVNLEATSADLVFLFGRVKDEALQKSLEEESATHGDIIQANFGDSYHNLSLSHLSMYSYVHYTCSTPEDPVTGESSYNPPAHIYKADDDFLLNLRAAQNVARVNPDTELFGCAYCGTPPIRNRAYMTKYYTPRYMYMGETYLGYLSGVAYMIQGLVLPRFIAAAQTIPIIHMDDAYITGLVPAALEIYPHNSNFFGYGRMEPEAGCQLQRMACSYVLNQDDMRAQWKGTEEFRLRLEQSEADAMANCTALPEETLKVIAVDDEFKKVCRYT